MKNGLKRLFPAIQRELHDVEQRAERKHLEREVQRLQKFEAIERLSRRGVLFLDARKNCFHFRSCS
jgi:hypothetical protein